MPKQAMSYSYINHIEHLNEVKFSLIMVNQGQQLRMKLQYSYVKFGKTSQFH